MQKVAGAFVAAVLVLCGQVPGSSPASAQRADKHAAIVADANNGAVLHADQADELRYPASLTKIMTIYLAFEAIEQGRASYATRIKISHEAASASPTKLDLDPGETIALIDAMKALITKSANDVAIAIAEHFGGTEARFAQMMTAKARLFGMSNTTFRNASGLPHPGQITTARDMLRLALRVQDDFPKHYHLFATRTFTYDGSTHRNHNNLLHRFQGTDGIKTGYTRASGFNLVSSVRRGGRHVIGVVLGGRTAGRRDIAMQMLVSRALMQSSPYKTRKSAPVLVAAASPAQRAQPTPPRVAEAPQPRPVMVPQRLRPEPPRDTLAPLPPKTRPVQSLPVQSQPVQAPPVLVAAPTTAVRPLRPSPAGGGMDHSPTRFGFAPHGFGERAGNTPSPRPTPGARPSTLQQQARDLAQIQPPQATPPQRIAGRTFDPPSGVRGPMPVTSAPAASGNGGPPGFEIQIGAYQTATEADRALAAARNTAGDLLQARTARAIPVAKENRQIFRARFAGFDSRTAASTCLELRRRQIDCFVMRSE